MATYSNLIRRNLAKLSANLKLNSLHTISSGIPYKTLIDTNSDVYKV